MRKSKRQAYALAQLRLEMRDLSETLVHMLPRNQSTMSAMARHDLTAFTTRRIRWALERSERLEKK